MKPEQTIARLNPYFLSGLTNCSEISRQSGIPVRTVNRYFKNFKNNVPFSELRPRGRPLTFPRKLNTKIAKKVKENNSKNLRMITNSLNEALNVPVSRRTVR